MNEEPLFGVMDKLQISVKQLKKFADEAGADIENYSLDFKLYLQDEEKNNLPLKAAEKRKSFFEEKSKKDHVVK